MKSMTDISETVYDKPIIVKPIINEKYNLADRLKTFGLNFDF